MLKGDATKTSDIYSYAMSEAQITDTNGDPVSLYDKCGTKLSVEQTKAAIKNGDTVYSTKGTAGTAATANDAKNDGSVYVFLNKDLYDKAGHKALSAGEIIKEGDYTAADYYTDNTGADGSKLANWADANDGSKSIASVDLYNADGTLKYKAGSAMVADDVTNITKLATTKATLGTEAVEGTDFVITEPNLYDKDGNGIAANGLESYFEKNDEGSLVYKGGLFDSNKNTVGTVGSTLEEDEDLSKYIGKEAKAPGALSFNLHVGADATENNQIQLEISAMDSETLGIKSVSVDTEKDALSTIETVKAAIQKVSTQRSALGAVQNRLEHTIANLDNVVENTTAAESQIRDTDMATEMVKYSNNNILAQAGQAMLAQANQANQGVLSLLG